MQASHAFSTSSTYRGCPYLFISVSIVSIYKGHPVIQFFSFLILPISLPQCYLSFTPALHLPSFPVPTHTMGCGLSRPIAPFSSSHLSSKDSYYSAKIRRLNASGVFILIDASNFELEGQKLSHQLRFRKAGVDPSWRPHYGKLISLISSNLEQNTSRDIVATHVISSEGMLARNQFSPGRNTWKRLGITFTIPNSRNYPNAKRNGEDEAFTRGEKGVDQTLVRIMTQEFEGLHLLHGDSRKRPKRTFALVAGDFDYVDVVEQARLSGNDVEIWYWTGRKAMSTQWVREESRRHDRIGTLTFHDLREHFQSLTAILDEEELKIQGMEIGGDRPDRLSFGSGGTPLIGGKRRTPRKKNTGSSSVTPKIRLGGGVGNRRVGEKGDRTPTSSVLTSELGADGGSFSDNSGMVRGGMEEVDFDENRERCPLREFCNVQGCQKRHTEAERLHFSLHGGKGRYKLRRVKKSKGKRKSRNAEQNSGSNGVLLQNEQNFCIKCLKVHEKKECFVERNRPINPLEARPLIQEGYLIDMLVAKSLHGKSDPFTETEGKQDFIDGDGKILGETGMNDNDETRNTNGAGSRSPSDVKSSHVIRRPRLLDNNDEGRNTVLLTSSTLDKDGGALA